MQLSVRPFGKNVLLEMVVRKTKEDRSIRETQPVVLLLKQKESLSYMNSREFTSPLLVLIITSLIIFSIRDQLT